MIGRQALAEQATGHGGARRIAAVFYWPRFGGGPPMTAYRHDAATALK